MTIPRSLIPSILVPLVFSVASCEAWSPVGTQTARAPAASDAARDRSASSLPHAERWEPAAPLFAYTLEAPLERSACAEPDQRHKIQGRIDRTVVKVAGEQLNLPLGSGRFLSVNGRRYLFCLEQHYRAPGAGPGPTGWHKGVTVYAVPAEPAVEKTAELGGGLQRSG